MEKGLLCTIIAGAKITDDGPKKELDIQILRK